ncbi:transmembrane protein 199-like [Clytia hemisphaerica]|uniref:Transmembrane protein n=1 Tax=Clytia hemisphaerica TaxID=252671 RepID=A0A7M5X1X3_9CNID
MSGEGIETRVTMTSEIKKFLQDLYDDRYLDRFIRSKIRIALTPYNNDEEVTSISYDVLSEIHQHYSDFKRPKNEKDFIDFRELLKTGKIYNYNIPVPNRSKELVERLSKLQKNQEQKEYDSMVKNIKKKKKTLGQEIGTEIRTSKQQCSSIINFLLSVGAAFAFGFVSSQYAFSDDLGFRVIFSIFLATIVAIAELYFMSKVEI